jgi:hypothetical protein
LLLPRQYRASSCSPEISAAPVDWSGPLAADSLATLEPDLTHPRYKNPLDALALLRAVSQSHPIPSLSDFSHAQIHWIIKTGLAPLVCFLSRTDSRRCESPLWCDLEAANLSVRFSNDLQHETLRHLLKCSQGLLPPITLLKGCSVASEFYPETHLRVMRDLDVFVEAKDQPIIESLLFEMGFRQQSTNTAAYYLTHHHSMPFYHSPTGVWVEIHHGLFPQASRLSALPVFSRDNIAAESRLCQVDGIAVKRFTPELQIVYTASHWALGLIDLKHRGGLFAFLDTIFILRGAQHGLRWKIIFDWVGNSLAATHLYLLLSYLQYKNIVCIDQDILRELFGRQKSFGMTNLKIAHWLITRYLVVGTVPLARGKLSILWENLLRDQGPSMNLATFVRQVLSLPVFPKNQVGMPRRYSVYHD